MKRHIISLILSLAFSLGAFAQGKAGDVITGAIADVENFFTRSPIDDDTFSRMTQGGSYPIGCGINRNDLCYLRVLHINFNGESQIGELVCNRLIANDLLQIFRTLYDNGYPIARMVLIDEYGADDETSMRANNTSCFCYRKVNGSAKLSAHSRGMAIDINPLQNPCVKRNKDGSIRKIQPDTLESRRHAARNAKDSHEIDRHDICYRLFTSHGFTWGGAWRTVKDYQHFEK